jgi:hypothetical protein
MDRRRRRKKTRKKRRRKAMLEHAKMSKGGQNFMCDKCQDKGHVLGALFGVLPAPKTCPKCNGDPRSAMPPRPPAPMGSGGNLKRDPIIESWEAYRNS